MYPVLRACRAGANSIRQTLFRCTTRDTHAKLADVLIYRQFSSSSAKGERYRRFSEGGYTGSSRNNPRDWRTWDPRVKLAVGSGALGVVYYISHQERVPDTGRWRFMNTSLEAEAKLGEAMYKEMLAELGPKIMPVNHPISIHVRRVVTRLLEASNLGHIKDEKKQRSVFSPFEIFGGPEEDAWNPVEQYGDAKKVGPLFGPDKEWNVMVVNDNRVINAMAFPGTVVVFTGILLVTQDEEGLASVLAHEIGHVVARHTAERMSSQTLSLIIRGLLSFVLDIDAGITGIFNSLFLELPNSRTQEREADLLGLRLMSKACYDPAAAPQMFSRLAKIEGRSGAAFMRTHPTSESRVKLLEEALPQGYAIMAANPDCSRIREEIEAFKASARPIKPTRGGWEIAS